MRRLTEQWEADLDTSVVFKLVWVNEERLLPVLLLDVVLSRVERQVEHVVRTERAKQAV